MANNILVDTSVLIELQRGNEETIQKFSETVQSTQISRITAAELLYGARNKKEKKINKDFIKELNVIEVDSEISVLSYELIDKYGLKTKFGIADALIAATAIAKKVPLWTRNIKHFKQIKGLTLSKS